MEQTAKQNARTSRDLLKRDDLTDEQRSRFEAVREKSEEYLTNLEQKRREQEALEAEIAREKEFAEYALAADTIDDIGKVSPEASPQTSPGSTPGPAHEATHSADRQNATPAPLEQAVSQAASARSSIVSAPPSTVETVGNCLGDRDAIRAIAEAAAVGLSRPPELADYLQSLASAHERIYIGNRIPEVKLENARKGRPVYCRSAKALLLADDTVMGGGKDGLLITDEHISFKAAFSDSHNYAFKHAQKLTVPDGFKFHIIPAEAIDNLLCQLRKFFSDRRLWHERAAQAGDRDSQFSLSFQYETADERGPYWLIRAAQSGHPIAQHNLGMMLKESNRAMAMHWFELAAAQGHGMAGERLATFRSAPTTDQVPLPKGATRLIDLMPPQDLRALERNISDSREAMSRAMQRIAEEEQRQV